MKSIVSKATNNLSKLLEMLFLRNERNSFGSKDGRDTDVFQEVDCTSSENLTDLVKRQEVTVIHFFLKFRQVCTELLRSEEL